MFALKVIPRSADTRQFQQPLDVIDHVSRLDVRAEIKHQVAVRVDKVETARRDSSGSLDVEYREKRRILKRNQAPVLFGTEEGIGRLLSMLEHALDAVHLLAQQEP